MIDAPLTGEQEIAAAADALLRPSGGVALYDVLDQVASRHRLADVWLVMHPSTGPQVFRRARWAAPVESVAALVTRPAGVYTDPPIDAATSRVIATLCEAAFRTSCSEASALEEPTTGLGTRRVIDDALVRAAARGARYGWTSTAVLLSAVGDAPAGERWLALAAALRVALRSGDEAGVERPGLAVAILPNAGADAVRPFVARVRAALSGAGGDGMDLLAATATTPTETADPAELKRLAHERLVEVEASSGAPLAGRAFEERPGQALGAADLWRLEVDLRMAEGVVSVGFTFPPQEERLAVSVVARGDPGTVEPELSRVLETHVPGAALTVHALGGAPAARPVPSGYRTLDRPRTGNGTGAHPPDGTQATRASSAPPLLSASAPGGPAPQGAPAAPRTTLLRATFDPGRGVSEVTLGLGSARGTGRAPAGPLAGGAQATLTAIAALGVEVPFYLVSAERARGIPGEPVVVVLAPRQARTGTSGGTGERMGVAGGGDDVEAASRATLGALNRHLAKTVPPR